MESNRSASLTCISNNYIWTIEGGSELKLSIKTPSWMKAEGRLPYYSWIGTFFEKAEAEKAQILC